MDFLKQTIAQFSKDRCTTLAAALAFYTAFALPPLLYLLLMVLTFGFSLAYESENTKERATAVLEKQAAEMLGNESAAKGISTILENNAESGGQWWKTLVSLAGIIVGATGVVGALQGFLNEVWHVRPDPETTGIVMILWKRVMSFAMILGLGFLMLVSLVVSSVLSGAGERVSEVIGISGGAADLINYLVQALVVFVVFAAIFKFMPDAEVQWNEVAVGAAITTVLFLLGRVALQLYFSFSAPGAQLGAAAASLQVILIAWVEWSTRHPSTAPDSATE